MPGIIKTICSALAGTALLATTALADDRSAQIGAALQPSEPLSFSTQSSAGSAGPSSFIAGPNWMLVAFLFPHDSHGMTVLNNAGTREEGVLHTNTLGGARLEFGWEIAAASAASSASSNPLAGIVPYFVLGAMALQNDVNYLTFAPGGFAATGNGARSKFYGVYGGLNVLLFGDPISRNTAAASSVASSLAFGGFSWMLFGNLGYGVADLDVPNFNFYRDADGIYYEVGTRFLFDFGLIQGGPGVSYIHFDNGPVQIKDTFWTLDFLLPF